MDNKTDYYVRYGQGSKCLGRTDYDTLNNSQKEYDKIKLNENITWKELWWEKLEDNDHQQLIKDDEVKVVDLGLGKVIIPN